MDFIGFAGFSLILKKDNIQPVFNETILARHVLSDAKIYIKEELYKAGTDIHDLGPSVKDGDSTAVELRMY